MDILSFFSLWSGLSPSLITRAHDFPTSPSHKDTLQYGYLFCTNNGRQTWTALVCLQKRSVRCVAARFAVVVVVEFVCLCRD